jgi:multidrug resistance efflux pump
MLRKSLIVALFLVLGLLLIPRLFNRFSGQAMVNAPMVELRAPVEAVALKINHSATGLFEETPQTIVTLKTRLADQLLALREQERMLQKRAASFIGDEKQRLQLELVARQGDLRRADLDMTSESRELSRQQDLSARGFISVAQVDTARLRSESTKVAREIATANASRAQNNLAALMLNGFVGERSGSNDVSATQQKLDEVRLRISELEFWSSSLQPVGESGASPLAGVRTPGQGLLMGPFVTEGAFLAPGDLIAHYVLCTQSFVDLSVPLNDLKDYRVGEPITFRVAGEWNFYSGKISRIYPVYGSSPKLALAVKSDSRDLEGNARVWVQPDAAFLARIKRESNCMTGQKLHAQLARGSEWMMRSASFLADVF